VAVVSKGGSLDGSAKKSERQAKKIELEFFED
jgi:hypothetical protein